MPKLMIAALLASGFLPALLLAPFTDRWPAAIFFAVAPYIALSAALHQVLVVSQHGLVWANRSIPWSNVKGIEFRRVYGVRRAYIRLHQPLEWSRLVKLRPVSAIPALWFDPMTHDSRLPAVLRDALAGSEPVGT